MKEKKIVYIKTDEVKLLPGNPQKMTDKEMEKLKKNIQEFGFLEPILIDEYKTVYSGNHRIQALKELNIQLPIEAVQIIGYTEDEKKIIAVSMNKIHGEFDLDLLDDFLDGIDFNENDFDLTGFDENELNIDTNEKENNSNLELLDNWDIIINCESEEEQEKYLNEFLERNIKCKALM